MDELGSFLKTCVSCVCAPCFMFSDDREVCVRDEELKDDFFEK